MHAVADFGVRIGNVLRLQAAVDRLPGLAAVVGAERAGGGDGDVHALGIGADRAGSCAGPCRRRRATTCGPVPWPRRPGQLVPVLAAVGRAEDGRVFDAGVDRVRIVQRRLQVPDALELPRVLRAVVPLVRGERLAGFGRRVVDELVALALGHAVGRRGRLAGRRAGLVPRFAAVVGALDDLPEPAAGLRGVDPVRIDGRALHVIDLPAAEMRAADVPLLALAVGRENERALSRADQNSYAAHIDSPLNCDSSTFCVRRTRCDYWQNAFAIRSLHLLRREIFHVMGNRPLMPGRISYNAVAIAPELIA